MGQNKVYTSTAYGHPEASNNGSYKATVKSATAQQAATSRPSTSGRSGENKGKPDVWGPIYRNRQNFVDMHIC